MIDDFLVQKAIRCRCLEETLLAQFKKGEIGGTVHTSIGQEMVAILLSSFLEDNDWIFSNHRGHSHFLAQYDKLREFLAEVMGRSTGLCGGFGGSQHLHFGRFFSNGIQGGMAPIACGVSYREQTSKSGLIAVCYIGDGTLGQGVLYESLNIAGWLQLPILFVLEDNRIAQSTPTAAFGYGQLKDRLKGFNFSYLSCDSDDWQSLEQTLYTGVTQARKCMPTLVRVKTRRLMSHSKGDDNRDEEWINDNWSNDPLSLLLQTDPKLEDFKRKCLQEFDEMCAQIAEEQPLDHVEKCNCIERSSNSLVHLDGSDLPQGSVRESLNSSLFRLLENVPTSLLIGEDIRTQSKGVSKEYGGAFKITNGLSDEFDSRVLNFPISEQAITGFGIGHALTGAPTVAEIMFGDFTTLIVDQLHQQAAKFQTMYGKKVHLPLIVRTPMGGGRGYGPTHSQSLERLFLGVDGLRAISLNPYLNTDLIYDELISSGIPSIIFENKIGYGDRAELYGEMELLQSEESIPTTIIRRGTDPAITLLAHGRAATLVVEAMSGLNGVAFELLVPAEISKPNLGLIQRSIIRSGRCVAIEEGSRVGSLASHVMLELAATACVPGYFECVSNENTIPTSLTAETKLLPSLSSISRAIERALSYDY